jgi:hypothetical protein
MNARENELLNAICWHGPLAIDNDTPIRDRVALRRLVLNGYLDCERDPHDMAIITYFVPDYDDEDEVDDDAEQTIRRAVANVDGIDAERMAARLAFDFEAEAIQKRNEEK